MRFEDIYTNKLKRYSLGNDLESGKRYLSFPVSNQYVDYEEYYELSENLFINFPETEALVEVFLDECRNHKHDNLLLQKPGRLRGNAS